MAKILYGTHYITEDEPCMGLREVNLQVPNKGFRRFQIIFVMRGNKPAEYRKDMGAASKFKADQLNILGGARDDAGRFHIEHTVGELRDIADYMRERPAFDKRELAQTDNIKIAYQ